MFDPNGIMSFCRLQSNKPAGTSIASAQEYRRQFNINMFSACQR
jgi:hypothetical protein